MPFPLQLAPRMIIAFRLLTILLVAAPCMAGPFGIDSGSELPPEAEPSPYLRFHYMVDPPTPHPAFERYDVRWHPGYGICSISATTEPLEIVEGDLSIRRAFRQLAGHLTWLYGEPDRLSSHWAADQDRKAEWDNPRDEEVERMALHAMRTENQKQIVLVATFHFGGPATGCAGAIRTMLEQDPRPRI